MNNKNQPAKGYYLKEHPERKDCGYFCCDNDTLDAKEHPYLFSFLKLHPSAKTYLNMFANYMQQLFVKEGHYHLLKYQDNEFGVYLYTPGNPCEIARVQIIDDQKGAAVLDVLMRHFNSRNDATIQNAEQKNIKSDTLDDKHPQMSFLEEYYTEIKNE